MVSDDTNEISGYRLKEIGMKVFGCRSCLRHGENRLKEAKIPNYCSAAVELNLIVVNLQNLVKVEE